ncbi:MAG: hypothetical protein ACRDSG_13730, partial [Pseudonocardiaceae bacterium]
PVPRPGSSQGRAEIVYRAGWRGRRSTMAAGLLSSAVLALPDVAASVLATMRDLSCAKDKPRPRPNRGAVVVRDHLPI